MAHPSSTRVSILPVLCLSAILTATGRAGPPSPSAPSGSRVDYKVVVWYRRDRALETFRYQVYDIRKSQYTPAVDGWLQTMRSRYPGYVALIRDVDLERERGSTESLRVGAVIQRELMAAASLDGVFVGMETPRPPLPVVPGGGRSVVGPPGIRYAAPARPVDLGPPVSSTPFPVPYPRPHP